MIAFVSGFSKTPLQHSQMFLLPSCGRYVSLAEPPLLPRQLGAWPDRGVGGQKMATYRHIHHVADVPDGCLDASFEFRGCTASDGENTLDANKADFRHLLHTTECRLSLAFCVLPIEHRLRRSTCDRRVYTSLKCLATSGECAYILPMGSGSCPVTSAFW